MPPTRPVGPREVEGVVFFGAMVVSFQTTTLLNPTDNQARSLPVCDGHN